MGVFRVVGIGFDPFVISPSEGPGNRTGCHRGGILQHMLHQCLLIDRIVDRPAHPRVAKWLGSGIENHEPQMRPRLLVDPEAWVVAQQGNVVRRELGGDVDAIRHQLGDASHGIGEWAKDQHARPCRLVPVVRITFQHHPAERLPFHEAEWAGARRPSTVADTVMADRCGRNHEPGRVGKVGQQRCKRLCQMKRDGMPVEYLDGVDLVEEER